MRITLITVGKIKEKFFADAIKEYSKRLSRYCKLEIVEVADEKTPDGASDLVVSQIKDKEAERMEKELAALTDQKDQLMAEYRSARSEAQEYETIRQNVDALLSVPKEQEQQRRHELE